MTQALEAMVQALYHRITVVEEAVSNEQETGMQQLELLLAAVKRSSKVGYTGSFPPSSSTQDNRPGGQHELVSIRQTFPPKRPEDTEGPDHATGDNLDFKSTLPSAKSSYATPVGKQLVSDIEGNSPSAETSSLCHFINPASLETYCEEREVGKAGGTLKQLNMIHPANKNLHRQVSLSYAGQRQRQRTLKKQQQARQETTWGELNARKRVRNAWQLPGSKWSREVLSESVRQAISTDQPPQQSSRTDTLLADTLTASPHSSSKWQEEGFGHSSGYS